MALARISFEIVVIPYLAAELSRYSRGKTELVERYADVVVIQRYKRKLRRNNGIEWVIQMDDHIIAGGNTRSDAIGLAQRKLRKWSEKWIEDHYAPNGRPRRPNDEW